MKEYKVVTMKETFWTSKFNPEEIEDLLNKHAKRGWELKESMINKRDAQNQFFFILEKEDRY